MVVKLGVNLLEARIPSANPIIESSSNFISLLFLFLKPQRSRFHPKQKTPSMVLLSNISLHLLFKSSSESVRRIISSFIEYYYLLKLLNTLPLLIYNTQIIYGRQQSNVLHPKSINRCVEFKAESKSSTITLSHSIPSAVLSNITIVHH
jgi:hypothetical protein